VPDVELTFSSPFPQQMAAVATTLPKDISRLGQEVKLFGKWDTQEYAPRLSSPIPHAENPQSF